MLEKDEVEIVGSATDSATGTESHPGNNSGHLIDADDISEPSPLPALLSPVNSDAHVAMVSLSKRSSSVRSLKLQGRNLSIKSQDSIHSDIVECAIAKKAQDDFSLFDRNYTTEEIGVENAFVSSEDLTKEGSSKHFTDFEDESTNSPKNNETSDTDNDRAEVIALKRADTHILEENITNTPSAGERCYDHPAEEAMDDAAEKPEVDTEPTSADDDSNDGTDDSGNCKPTGTDNSDKSVSSDVSPANDKDQHDVTEPDDDAMDTSDAVLPPVGPGPIEIVISFDTTGSMSNCLDEVKNRINDVINRLFMDIPSLKIGVIAHGDYCDEKVYYLTQAIDLTNDVNALCTFVRDVEGTGGGDFPECYELILRKARLIKWTPGSQRALIMIGDACPHTPEQLKNEGKEVINWAHEANQLQADQGVKVYGVQCLNHPEAGTFWRDVAAITGGGHLRLDTLDSIVDIIMAICYKEGGHHYLDAYEKEVREREGRLLAAELDAAFGALRTTSNASTSGPGATASSSTPSTSVASKIKTLGGASKNTKVPPRKTQAKKTTKATSTSTNKTHVRAPGKAIGTAAPHTHLYKKKTPTAKKSRRVTTKRKQIPIVHKQSRDRVIEANFALSHLPWSKWELFMTSQMTVDSTWHTRNTNCFVRHIPSFTESSIKRSAVYELAVQVKPSCKRHVVYARATKGVQSKNWIRSLFRKVLHCIDAVLEQGVNDITIPNNQVKIFIRRAFLGQKTVVRGVTLRTPSTVNMALHKMYSYPWHEHVKNCSTKSFPCDKRITRYGINIC